MTHETLTDRMLHAATHCETMYDAEWEAQQLRDGAAEILRLRGVLLLARGRLLQANSAADTNEIDAALMTPN